jgi:hypothetical protein
MRLLRQRRGRFTQPADVARSRAGRLVVRGRDPERPGDRRLATDARTVRQAGLVRAEAWLARCLATRYTETAFSEYEENRGYFYRLETRWPDSPCWIRRNLAPAHCLLGRRPGR